jgi:hypothetical protein
MKSSYSLRVIKDTETGLVSETNSLMSVIIEQALSPVIIGQWQFSLPLQSVCNFSGMTIWFIL